MEHSLNNIIFQKNIIIVGNSSQLLDLQQGKHIDSYDIIIRFNFALENLSPEITGIKTNIWSYAMVNEKTCKKVYKNTKYKPEYTMRYGNTPLNISEKDFVFPPQPYKKECIDLLKLKQKKIPSSGFVILYYILNYCKPKSITIIGFDSFRHPNYYNMQNNNARCKWHDGDQERKYIQEINKKNFHIIS